MGIVVIVVVVVVVVFIYIKIETKTMREWERDHEEIDKSIKLVPLSPPKIY